MLLVLSCSLLPLPDLANCQLLRALFWMLCLCALGLEEDKMNRRFYLSQAVPAPPDPEMFHKNMPGFSGGFSLLIHFNFI